MWTYMWLVQFCHLIFLSRFMYSQVYEGISVIRIWSHCSRCSISSTASFSCISFTELMLPSCLNVFYLGKFTVSISYPQFAISFSGTVPTSVFSVLTMSYCKLKKLIVLPEELFPAFFCGQKFLGQREICISLFTSSKAFNNQLVWRDISENQIWRQNNSDGSDFFVTFETNYPTCLIWGRNIIILKIL